ncbi:MAG: hypothetical protein Q4A34_02060 [Candidatus Saccharibacteria bacterium]|nr:hypothetical protein [Candidatus Saccharibacteria bacterium]
MAKQQYEYGSVSIFAVVFASLLMTIITVSFIKLMVIDQQRAAVNDLSQSAYDAALAGVEDAKRVVRACQQNPGSAACAALASGDCDTIAKSGVIPAQGLGDYRETMIQSAIGGATVGKEFDQAYTCVRVDMNTPDYVYTAREGVSHIVSLRSASDFARVRVEWFTRQDNDGREVLPPMHTDGLPELGADRWGAQTPPLLRAQLITPGASYKVQDLDATTASYTAFISPAYVTTTASSAPMIIEPSERRQPSSPHHVTCTRAFSYSDGVYACQVELRAPSGSVSAAASHNALLRLMPVYRGATVRVTLMNQEGATVPFYGVQPRVDATGRANNVFRRVAARLQIGESGLYPESALEADGDVCKNFVVAGDEVVVERPNGIACEPWK